MKFVRKHQYVLTGEAIIDIPDYPKIRYPIYTCECCGNVSNLDEWKIQNMPGSMGICPNGKWTFDVFPLIMSSFNCLKNGRKKT